MHAEQRNPECGLHAGTPASVAHILWSGEIGGAERAVYQLASRQRAEGRRHVAIGFAQARGPYWDLALSAGLRVIDLGMSGATDLSAAARAMPFFRAHGIHHFHVAEPSLMLASLTVSHARRLYTHRGGAFSYRGRRALRYRISSPLLRHGFVVTGTAQARAAAVGLFGVAAQDVLRTFNGFDPSLFASQVTPTKLREDMGVAPATTLVGTAANLRSWKRIDWLVEAAGRLAPGDWEVWVLGDGADRSRLETIAGVSPAAKRIRFLGAQQNIGDWLRALDVFVLPSGPEESFGNAVVEAMAYNLPVLVSSDCPAHIAHVEAGVTGFVVDDPPGLAVQLGRLLADPALRERVGAAAGHFAAETYSMDRVLTRYEGIYRDLGSASAA